MKESTNTSSEAPDPFQGVNSFLTKIVVVLLYISTLKRSFLPQAPLQPPKTHITLLRTII